MGVEVAERTQESSVRSRGRSSGRSRGRASSNSPAKPLASADSLGNSDTSRSLSVHDDEENWFGSKIGFDDVSKRTQTMHSIASTATITSNESSSHDHASFSNCKWSPAPERRLSNSFHKSPRKSPKYTNLVSEVTDTEEIASLPLTAQNSQAAENDRGIIESTRRLTPADTICKAGKGSYYQPSKASLHDSNQNQPPKKPQRIRNRSKGPLLRRKSHVEAKTASHQHNDRSSMPKGTGKRSKSCEPNGSSNGGTDVRSRSCDRNPATKAKTKASPSLSRHRKKPSSMKVTETQVATTNTVFHESWPRPVRKDNDAIERNSERNRRPEKSKVTEKSKQKKRSSKIKHTKVAKDEKTNDINDVIGFFEEMAANKAEIQVPSPPPPRGLGKKSKSARSVTRSRSPASSAIGNASADGILSDETILDSSNKRRERRSSAPAKALAAFNQKKQPVSEFEAENQDTDAPAKPGERIMLDVSELAALEIIRLGKDNSLKLDLFDLMKHLKRQQARQNR